MENGGSSSSSPAGSSSFFSYIPTVVVILAVVYAIALYVWPTDSTVVAMGPYELHGSSETLYPPIQLIDVASMLKSFANNFTFSTYIYISDVTKPIMTGQQPANTLITIRGAGTVSVNAQQNTATIALEPTNPPGERNPLSSVVVPQFMVARWNQLLFTVEGRTVDVYMNGVLNSSTLLDNVPLAAPTEIVLNVQPGFDGQLGYTQAWPRRLKMPEILANYKATSDYKGKPYIPDSPFNWSSLFQIMDSGFCKIGICLGDSANTGPLGYINYQY